MLSAILLTALAQLPPPLLPLPRPLPPVVVARQVAPPPPQPRWVPASHRITFWVENLPRCSREEAWRVATLAAQQWSRALDLDILPARSRDEAGVVVAAAPMHRGYGGLTMIGHPDRFRRGATGLTLHINQGFAAGPQSLMATVLHEWGHALGLGHGGVNMDASTVPYLTELTGHDAARGAALYGWRRNQ